MDNEDKLDHVLDEIQRLLENQPEDLKTPLLTADPSTPVTLQVDPTVAQQDEEDEARERANRRSLCVSIFTLLVSIPALIGA